MKKCAWAVAAVWFLLGSGLTERAAADEDLSRAVYVFAGRYTWSSMGDSANPFSADYESNYVLAAAYARDFWDLGWRLAGGLEGGLAARMGYRWSVEVWGGLVVRHRGITLADRMAVKPSLTAGLSLIDKPIGVERARKAGHDGNPILLFYLGPELAFSLVGRSDWELVYRLHHRSGANQTIGGMMEGHNANTLGLRRRF